MDDLVESDFDFRTARVLYSRPNKVEILLAMAKGKQYVVKKLKVHKIEEVNVLTKRKLCNDGPKPQLHNKNSCRSPRRSLRFLRVLPLHNGLLPRRRPGRRNLKKTAKQYLLDRSRTTRNILRSSPRFWLYAKQKLSPSRYQAAKHLKIQAQQVYNRRFMLRI